MIKTKLFEMQDLQYKAFQEKLMPTVNPDKIIGVRAPALRRLAKDFSKTGEAEDFMKILPHTYFEEDNLHAFLIEKMSDYQTVTDELNRFLPFIDNWGTCDGITPKIFSEHTEELISEIDKWLKSEHTYTVRFAVNMLMKFYLDDKFNEECLQRVADIKSDEYYVKMVQAWYFATALAKHWDSAVIYLCENKLDLWVHNKTIQKSLESYRITIEQKEYLKKLKRKS